MSIRYLLMLSVALGFAVPTAFGDEQSSPKEPTIEEDTARLVGEWEFKNKADRVDPKSKETIYHIMFDKDGTGSIREDRPNGLTSHGFNWTVTEVKGRGRVIVLIGNGTSSTAIQYVLPKEKDSGTRLLAFNGKWDSAIRLNGEWRKLVPERK